MAKNLYKVLSRPLTNPYRVLSRPHTKKADIIRATLPKAHDNCHVYATCASVESARHLCELLNLGLEAVAEQTVVPGPVKQKRKVRAR